MICPQCLNDGEVVYSAVSRELICLAPRCGWQRELAEDEVYELLFPAGSYRSNPGRRRNPARTEPSSFAGDDKVVA